MRHTRAEIKQIEEDRDYWNELAELLGWRLYGFTFRSGATFFDSCGQSAELRGSQRDDIMRAIAVARQTRGGQHAVRRGKGRNS